MFQVNYQKRKNTELFKSLESPDSLFLVESQNYIPIYTKFFSLNNTNYNNVNLNNLWQLNSVNKKVCDKQNLYRSNIKNIEDDTVIDKNVFFKLAPLLDPYKYLIGKYSEQNETIFKLPKIDTTEPSIISKFLDINNSAYVDGFFVFLTSKLLHQHNFINGLDYYGSFLSIKNNFIINVFDDIDYLNCSDYFNKNKNKLFFIEDYNHLFNDQEQKLKPITIEHNISSNSKLSLQSLDENIFEDIFEFENNKTNEETTELIDIKNMDITFNDNQNVTIKSNTTCSSRTSYTSASEDEIDEEDNMDDNEEELETNEENSENYEDDILNVTIPKFPVQVICMENCEKTFDELIIKNELKNEEWFATLMQVIMILISYQKVFNFTHNDLHTNNIMYVHTEKKYIYYCYKKKYYKVPTFGRIFKIIDFGRSIYKFNGNIFCSDSFQNGGDAATQYNTEPYFNEKKPRLEPNYSFDLCRLACSIYDYVIDETDDIRNINKIKDPIKKLILEWCLDDKGINILYKNNGDDRYPDFKLYKMIARCVHNHTPQAQLDRPEFKKFSNFKGEVPDKKDLIDIDKMPIYI
jgi:hypothetical protein